MVRTVGSENQKKSCAASGFSFVNKRTKNKPNGFCRKKHNEWKSGWDPEIHVKSSRNADGYYTRPKGGLYKLSSNGKRMYKHKANPKPK